MSPNLGCKEVSKFGEMQKSGQSAREYALITRDAD